MNDRLSRPRLFFFVADHSHHGYVSTSGNKKVFCQQGYLPELSTVNLE